MRHPFIHALTLNHTVGVAIDTLHECAEALGLDVSTAEVGQPFLMPDGLIVMVVAASTLGENDVIVCSRWEDQEPEYKATSKRGPCAVCGALVGWRPFLPDAPKKVCVACIERKAEMELLLQPTKGRH